MENQDIQLIEANLSTNSELKVIWEEHLLFSKQVEKLEAKPFLSPQEDLELKQLKKQKLDNKTALHDMLDKIRRV